MERENQASLYEAPPMRDRLPTIPHDLSEYARTETGPSPQDAYDDPLRAMTVGALVDVRPTDVPCLTNAAWEYLAQADAREANLLSDAAAAH